MDYSSIISTLNEDNTCKSILYICKKDAEKFIMINICDDNNKIYIGRVEGDKIIFKERGKEEEQIVKVSGNSKSVLKVNEEFYAYNITEELLSEIL